VGVQSVSGSGATTPAIPATLLLPLSTQPQASNVSMSAQQVKAALERLRQKQRVLTHVSPE
jgi:hypothetical protein